MSEHAEAGPTPPVELFRRALARLTPDVGASFAAAFLRDSVDPRLLRPVCAQNWPQAAAPWLSDMRIMVGRGPTGRAAGRNRAVEVPDVFADTALREWWDPARELGFVAMISLPLSIRGEPPLGAVSFYFAERRVLTEAEREVLEAAATRLAEAAAGAALNDVRSGPVTGSR